MVPVRVCGSGNPSRPPWATLERPGCCACCGMESGWMRDAEVMSVNVVEARKERAEEICRGVDDWERTRLFSGRFMELTDEGDMVEHTGDGWEGAMVEGRGGLCAFTPESMLGH